MRYGPIDWNVSIEKQIDEIVALLNDASRLMQQIKYKKYVRPEFITDENYSCFQSVICSMHDAIVEFEDNPLYSRALMQLCNRQKKRRQHTILKYLGYADGPRRR
jgi:hypothetical protein